MIARKVIRSRGFAARYRKAWPRVNSPWVEKRPRGRIVRDCQCVFFLLFSHANKIPKKRKTEKAAAARPRESKREYSLQPVATPLKIHFAVSDAATDAGSRSLKDTIPQPIPTYPSPTRDRADSSLLFRL